MRAWRLRRFVVVAAVITTATVLGSCGGGDDSPAESGPSVTKSIGAAGGSISTSDGGATLTVPPGALSASVDIKITEVLPENRTDQIKALNADKVYRFEPTGLSFMQPATLQIDLPPSPQGRIAALALQSNGQWESPSSQTLTMLADRRTLSVPLNHFSEAVVKTVAEVTATFDVAPRRIAAGQSLTATLTISRENVPWPMELNNEEVVHDYGITSFTHFPRVSAMVNSPFPGVPMTLVANDPLPVAFAFNPGQAQMLVSSATWRCDAAHSAKAFSFPIDLVWTGDPLAAAFILGLIPPAGRIEFPPIDYVCDAAEPPPSEPVQTGLFLMPALSGSEALKAPDGIRVVTGPFGPLSGPGPYALVTGENGAVVIDLTNGQVVLDMTSNGKDGQLGSGRLLGAMPISKPNPGPTTPAAFFATGQTGALRNFLRLSSGTYGWSASQQTAFPVIDVSSAGGGVVADEAVVATPFTGLHFLKYSDDSGSFEITDELVDAGAFSGTVRSALLPSSTPGGPLLVLTSASFDGSKSTVWSQARDNQPATELFSIEGNDAKAMRCSTSPFFAWPLLVGKRVCSVTLFGGKSYSFIYDPSRPTDKPEVHEATVGPGAFGVDVGADVAGNPIVVVANMSGQTLNVLRLDDQGLPSSNETIAVPSGCVDPPHASVFTDSGYTYVAGTCNGSGHYFVTKLQ